MEKIYNKSYMLYELMNSNYTRYRIELINRSRGGWLVCTLF